MLCLGFTSRVRLVSQVLLVLQVHLERAFRVQKESQVSRDHQAPEVSQEKALQDRRCWKLRIYCLIE